MPRRHRWYNFLFNWYNFLPQKPIRASCFARRANFPEDKSQADDPVVKISVHQDRWQARESGCVPRWKKISRITFDVTGLVIFSPVPPARVITEESWLTVYCRARSEGPLDDDEFARHATAAHAIPPLRTSLPRVRHANGKSGGRLLCVSKECVYARSPRDCLASIAARKSAGIAAPPLVPFPF